MSYFDEASLVMIPSGYKASKVYSVKPTDGSGDLTFTRSLDTATRVGPDGLIEKVRTNLATYSNAFSDGSWAKITDGTFTLATESITDAFGNTSAVFKVTLLTGSFLVFRKTLASATTQPTNFSLYVKKTISSTYVGIDIDDNTDVLSGANTNWQRISNTRATASFVDITTYSVGEPFYIFASQVELGDIATPYIPTTTAAVSVGMLANVPRLDYLNSSCPRLLLEPQRTNLVTFSEQLDNAAWGKDSSGTGTLPVVTANYTTSPDGYQNADRVQFSAVGKTLTTDYSLIGQYPITLGATGTFTFYLKSLTSGNQNVLVYWGAGQGQVYVVTPQWQRFTLENCASGLAGINIGTRGGSGFTAGGDQTLDIAIWGAQIEAGAYPTSYIPTLGAAVTRSADAASKTGISALIGQTEGTLFVDVDFNGTGYGATNDFFIYVGNGSNTNSIYIDYFNNLFRFIVFTSTSLTAYFDIATTNGSHKMALAYKSGSYAAYMDGVQIGVDAAVANPPTCPIFSLSGISGFNPLTKNTKQALLFKTRLSNAALAELTA